VVLFPVVEPLQKVCHGPARVLGHDCLPGPQTGILVAKSHVSDRHGHCLVEMTSSFLLKQSKYSRYVQTVRDLASWIVIGVKAREPRSYVTVSESTYEMTQ
jgi:hypothetical protein